MLKASINTHSIAENTARKHTENRERPPYVHDVLQELKPPTTPGGRRGSFNPAQEKGELEVSLPALNPLCLLQAGAARKKSLNPGDGEDGRVEVSGGGVLSSLFTASTT